MTTHYHNIMIEPGIRTETLRVEINEPLRMRESHVARNVLKIR